jgi:CheY-like chemotaxis protein
MLDSRLGLMSIVLICLADPVADGLDWTLLWRDDVDRRFAATATEVRALIHTLHPALLAVDRDIVGAEELVRDIRADERTRALSIVVAARGDLRPSELSLLDAGVNAVLRLPAGPAWDERLARLLKVPRRRTIRVPVRLQFEGCTVLDFATANGTILNLSERGMLIECDRDLDLGIEVAFSFQVPAAQSTVAGRGRIVRLAGAARFGVEFHDLAPAAIEQMARLRE